MIVSITPEDLRTGFRNSLCNCPIGRALRRMGFFAVRVTKTRAYFQDRTDRFFSDLPFGARSFIRAFDAGKEWREDWLTFKLEVLFRG